ncbi:hypothetical protein B0A55_06913 [Friedmanniomyces simplex]|uniref:Uncharacterized protein n=1 Tax=Friedmanniomyces simplex TaxID=329884 RepID=A0A4U0XBC8_9PEZI|nr:hypothetical protein B0A55_06913 [Friedmanniomyces simplex]
MPRINPIYYVDEFTIQLGFADTFDLRDKRVPPASIRSACPMAQKLKALMGKVKAGCGRLRASTRGLRSRSGSRVELVEVRVPEKSPREEAEELVALWRSRWVVEAAAEEAASA